VLTAAAGEAAAGTATAAGAGEATAGTAAATGAGEVATAGTTAVAAAGEAAAAAGAAAAAAAAGLGVVTGLRMPDAPTPAALAARHHSFWACPIAVAVVAELRRWPGAPPLTCADVWLLRVPAGAPLNGRVWALVCTAAIAAMDHGRRALWRGVFGGSAVEGQALMQVAAKKAVSHFWRLLQDFVLQGPIPDGWAAIPASHPFIGAAPPVLCLNLPEEFFLPADL